jgi:hypothetical protein
MLMSEFAAEPVQLTETAKLPPGLCWRLTAHGARARWLVRYSEDGAEAEITEVPPVSKTRPPRPATVERVASCDLFPTFSTAMAEFARRHRQHGNVR